MSGFDSFSVNKDFAAAYATKKQTEELSKLQDKYGANYTLSDEEDEEEDLSDDDSDGEFVTPQVDVAILRTLARIRRKDPQVYEEGREVFDEEESRTAASATTAKPSSKTTKPVLLKDYQRSRLIADPTDSLPSEPSSIDFLPTFAEEERALKREVTKAFKGDSDDDEDEEEDLLQPRAKTKDEREKEDEEYSKFLAANVGDREVEDALEQEEKFLRDYILNRGWIDRSGKSSRIPSYNEITGGPPPAASASGSNTGLVAKVQRPKAIAEDDEAESTEPADPGANDEEDDEYEERADDFENKYNFRFEEAAGQTMMTHSRGASTVRRPTVAVTARARGRDAAKERADEEKAERREEIRRLRALKRKEVEEKLLKLVEAAGEGAEGLAQMDLEADWDPEEHDRKMQEVYGGNYEGAEDDEFKPTWDDDIDISDLQALDGDAVASDGEQEDVEMEEDTPKKKEKKSKRKRDAEGFPTELLEAAKAGGGAERKALLEQMVDEYYKLDYEDKVGGMPTRFHYAKVAASDYNLDASEILMATDNELNSYMSIRKMAPYRREDEKKGKSKKRLKELRDSLKMRKWGAEIDEEAEKEAEARYGGKKVKWSEVDGRTKLDESETVAEEETVAPIPSLSSIVVPKRVMGGAERRQQVHPDRVAGAGPVKRGGKKERERRKKAEAAAGNAVEA